ncbi:PBECR2 nuclease fold domain-containing protein [Marinomonas sp. TI.3.20]|uniref:PBECR2 nuclease fold domain-containing protein n=1 Tax=Marinomonas sp. TI.3.20 TaxID=3121296 RepID=UPI00311F1CAA
MSKRDKTQPKWNELGLDDIRSLEINQRLRCPGLEEEAQDFNSAFEVLLKVFSLKNASDSITLKAEHIGLVDIKGNDLKHIVEKRNEARERFVHYALTTIQDPFEIWLSNYEDKTQRFQFIGSFQSKAQMLVVIAKYENQTLWNFMHTEAKKLNKHRCGKLVYQRKRATE